MSIPIIVSNSGASGTGSTTDRELRLAFDSWAASCLQGRFPKAYPEAVTAAVRCVDSSQLEGHWRRSEEGDFGFDADLFWDDVLDAWIEHVSDNLREYVNYESFDELLNSKESPLLVVFMQFGMDREAATRILDVYRFRNVLGRTLPELNGTSEQIYSSTQIRAARVKEMFEVLVMDSSDESLYKKLLSNTLASWWLETREWELSEL